MFKAHFHLFGIFLLEQEVIYYIALLFSFLLLKTRDFTGIKITNNMWTPPFFFNKESILRGERREAAGSHGG